jgi:predicted dithiol-disulfide oxidoreductase (DUF899 family)
MKTKIRSAKLPRVVSRDAWLKKRKDYLKKEKAFTKLRDAHHADLRRLPMVEITEPYVFEGPKGKTSLLELFDGRNQLIVYHFMWRWKNGKPQKNGCPSCSAWTDHLARGHLAHLRMRDTNLVLVSRAPLEKIEPFKKRMGWTIPWYSSAESRFNFDFHVSFDESITPLVYNYRPKDQWHGFMKEVIDDEQPYDLHGMSCFLRDGDRVFHTYSSYGRGCEGVGGANYFLDYTALGRQEPWEKPAGRILNPGFGAGSNRMRYPDQFTT